MRHVMQSQRQPGHAAGAVAQGWTPEHASLLPSNATAGSRGPRGCRARRQCRAAAESWTRALTPNPNPEPTKRPQTRRSHSWGSADSARHLPLTASGSSLQCPRLQEPLSLGTRPTGRDSPPVSPSPGPFTQVATPAGAFRDSHVWRRAATAALSPLRPYHQEPLLGNTAVAEATAALPPPPSRSHQSFTGTSPLQRGT